MAPTMKWVRKFSESSYHGKGKGAQSWWNRNNGWYDTSYSSYGSWGSKSKGETKKRVWKPKVQEKANPVPNAVLLGSPWVELKTQANRLEKIEMKSQPLSPSTTMAEDLAAAGVSEDDGPAEGEDHFGEAAQTVEKVVEIPQVGQTLQGTTQEVDMPLAEVEVDESWIDAMERKESKEWEANEKVAAKRRERKRAEKERKEAGKARRPKVAAGPAKAVSNNLPKESKTKEAPAVNDEEEVPLHYEQDASEWFEEFAAWHREDWW